MLGDGFFGHGKYWTKKLIERRLGLLNRHQNRNIGGKDVAVVVNHGSNCCSKVVRREVLSSQMATIVMRASVAKFPSNHQDTFTGYQHLLHHLPSLSYLLHCGNVSS